MDKERRIDEERRLAEALAEEEEQKKGAVRPQYPAGKGGHSRRKGEIPPRFKNRVHQEIIAKKGLFALYPCGRWPLILFIHL